MTVLAIIPLRSGSKRIKNKNIRIIDGLPLFYYIFRTALEIKEIDKIVVSTDSQEYKNICEDYGLEVIMRDKELSTDFTRSEDVILDVINKLDQKFEFTILLQATSPLTNGSDIKKSIDLIKNNSELKSVFAYYKFNGFFIDDKDIISRPRTQDKKPKFIESGNFWIFKTKDFLIKKNRLIEPLSGIEVSQLSSKEIDTYEDLEEIEPLLIKNNRVKYKKYYKSREYSDPIVEDPDGNIRDLKNESNLKYDDVKNEVEFINSLSNKRINFLDLGCGYGLVSSFINNKYNKYGLEPNEEKIKNATKYINQENLKCSELNEFTFSDNFFDIIMCYHVIEHVNDPEYFIYNVNRILKQNGILVISTPNFNSSIAQLFKDNYRLLHDKTHIKLFSDESFKFFLEDNGFYIIKIDFPFFSTRHFTKENLLRLLDKSKISPPFYGNIMTFYCLKK